MNIERMTWAIATHVERHGPALLPDLIAAMGPDASGDEVLSPDGFPEIVIWRGVSPTFRDALKWAAMSEAVRVEPTAIEDYGARRLNLPTRSETPAGPGPWWMPGVVATVGGR